MNRNCIACKSTASETAKVFNQAGIEVTINLCREHDIELYKAGQIKFMAKYSVKIEKSESDDILGEFA